MQGVPLSALAFSSPHTVFGPTVDPASSRMDSLHIRPYLRDRAHDSTGSWGRGTRTFDSMDTYTLLNRSEEIKNSHPVTSTSKDHYQHDMTSLRMSDASRTFSVWANGPPQCREMEMKINDAIFLNNRIKEAERIKLEKQGERQGASMQLQKEIKMMNVREYEMERETRRGDGNNSMREEEGENIRGKEKKEKDEDEDEDDSRIQDPRSLDGLCSEFHYLMSQLEGAGAGTGTSKRTPSKPLSSSLPMSQPMSRCLRSPNSDSKSNQLPERSILDSAFQGRSEENGLFNRDSEYENENKNECEKKVMMVAEDRNAIGAIESLEAVEEGEEEDIKGDALHGITLIDAIKSMTRMQQQEQQQRGQGQEQCCSQHELVGALQNRISSDIARMRDRLKDQTGEGVLLPIAASSSSSSSSSSSFRSSTFPPSSSSSTYPSYPSSSVQPSDHPSNRNVSHVPREGSSFADLVQESTVRASQHDRIGSWVESGSRSHHTGTEIRERKPLHSEGRDRTTEFRDVREDKSVYEYEYERESNVKMFRVNEDMNDNNNNDSDRMSTRRLSRAKHVTKANNCMQNIENKEILSRRTKAFKQSTERTIDPISSSSHALPSSSLPSSPSAYFPSSSASSSSLSSSPMREVSKHAGMERVKRGNDIGGGKRVIASKTRARQSAGEEKGVEEGGNDYEGEGTEGKEVEDEEKDSGGGEEKLVNEEEVKEEKEEEEEQEELGEDKTEEDDKSRISDESDSEQEDDNNDDNDDNRELSKVIENKNKMKKDAKFMRNTTIHATQPTRVSSIRQSFNNFLEADQHSHSLNQCAVTTIQDTEQLTGDRRDKVENDGESSMGVAVSDVSIAKKSGRYQEKYRAIMTAALSEEEEENGEEKKRGDEKECAKKSGIMRDRLRWKRGYMNPCKGGKESTSKAYSTAPIRGSGEKNLSRRIVKDRSSKERSASVAIGGIFSKSYYEDQGNKYHRSFDYVCSSGESEGEQWSVWNADLDDEGEEEAEEIELETAEEKEKEIGMKKEGCKEREEGLAVEADISIVNSRTGDKRDKSAVNKSRSKKEYRVETKKSKSNKKRNGKNYHETNGVEDKERDDHDNDDNSDDNEEESSDEIIRYRRGKKDWSDYIRAPRYIESEDQEQEGEVEGAEEEEEDEGENKEEGEGGEEEVDEGEGEEEEEDEEEETSTHREGRGEPRDVTERYSHCLASHVILLLLRLLITLRLVMSCFDVRICDDMVVGSC